MILNDPAQEFGIAFKGDGCTVATKTSANKYNFTTDLKVLRLAT